MDLGYSLAGAFVGFLVVLTGVGGGSLMAPLLILLFGFSPAVAIGTDIIHAIPLTLVAALGHSWLGNVAGWLLISLLIGSVPGIVLGSLATGHVNDKLVRYALAAMLVISAIKMIAS